MTDGRYLGKVEKLLYLSNGLTDRQEIWHGDTVWPPDPSNRQDVEILKLQDGGGPYSENKLKNCHFTDRYHRTLSISPNKTADIIKQNCNQFPFLVKATAWKQQIS